MTVIISLMVTCQVLWRTWLPGNLSSAMVYLVASATNSVLL